MGRRATTVARRLQIPFAATVLGTVVALVLGSTGAFDRLENDTVRIVPGGPRKSM